MKNVLNRPEKLTLGFTEENLPPLEGDEDVKLEPEETIVERVKSNPPRRKNQETGLKSWIQTNY